MVALLHCPVQTGTTEGRDVMQKIALLCVLALSSQLMTTVPLRAEMPTAEEQIFQEAPVAEEREIRNLDGSYTSTLEIFQRTIRNEGGEEIEHSYTAYFGQGKMLVGVLCFTKKNQSQNCIALSQLSESPLSEVRQAGREIRDYFLDLYTQYAAEPMNTLERERRRREQLQRGVRPAPPQKTA